MALNEVLTEGFVGEKEGVKQPQRPLTLKSISLFKLMESNVMRVYGIQDANLRSLILIVDYYLEFKKSVTTTHILRLHGYGKNWHYPVNERLRKLVSRGLLDHHYNSLGHNAFVPTKRGIECVLSTIV